jgi:formate-dependent nitrite reductase cytochrome c552 subunit
MLLCVLCVLCGEIRSSGQQQPYVGIEEKLPLAVAPQPVPFSHKRHADAGAQCLDCHAKALTGDRATIPQADQCKLCHPAMKLDPKIAWVRVYKLPDFVVFSHAAHGKAGIDCATCHGPVARRAVLQKEVSTSMRTCVDCHRLRKASIDCSRCHELGQ